MLLKRIALVVLLAFLIGSGIAFVGANCHNDQDHDGDDCEEPFQHLLTGKKWQWLEDDTLEYYIDSHQPIPGLPQITPDVRAAASAWSGIQVGQKRVRFYLDDSSSSGVLPVSGDDDNVVGWYPLSSTNTDFTANAAIRVQSNTTRIIEVDLQLNYYSPFSTHENASVSTYCLRNTLTHEFGHWLGLGDVNPGARV